MHPYKQPVHLGMEPLLNLLAFFLDECLILLSHLLQVFFEVYSLSAVYLHIHRTALLGANHVQVLWTEKQEKKADRQWLMAYDGTTNKIVLWMVTHTRKTKKLQTFELKKVFTSSWFFLRKISSSCNPDNWICRSSVANLVSPRTMRKRARSASTSKCMFLSLSNLQHQTIHRD